MNLKVKKEKGITLIALIVTIIVLLILAAISIAMLTGQNGILGKAADTKKTTSSAQLDEQVKLAIMEARLNGLGKIESTEALDSALKNNVGEGNYTLTETSTGWSIETSKKKYELDVDGNVTIGDNNQGEGDDDSKIESNPKMTDIPNESKTVSTLDRKNGSIDIIFLEDTGYNLSRKPNAPALDDTMVPVKYDEGTKNWIVCSEDDEEWYKYEKQEGMTDGKTSRWANVMLTDDIVVEKDGTKYNASSIKNLLTVKNLSTIVGATVTTEGSMMVWIPRYAYRITYYDTESKANIIGYSDSRGIVTKEGETPSDYQTPTISMGVNGKVGNTTYEYYRTHPAFETDLDQGGWSDKLTGIWVGKFEATGTTSNVTIKSSEKAIVDPTIGILWQSIKNNFKAKTTESHMIKNSEWGAVTYLTESNYGRNGTPVSRNEDSGKYAGGSNEKGAYKKNEDQSTTGNVYGIYDTVGGTYEYVAGYVANSKNSNGYQFASKDGQTTSRNDNEVSTKYATVYKYNSASDINNSASNYILSLNKIFGDAIIETSVSGYDSKAWHSARAYFVGGDLPFFMRGGRYDNSSAGSFCFYLSTGNDSTFKTSGSRICCIIK